MRWRSLLVGSARPYLFAIIIAVVAGKVGQYLWQYVWPGLPLIKGQAPGIWIPFLGVCFASVLWLLYRGQRTTSRWTLALLAGLTLTWGVQATLTRVHTDQTPYTTLLVPVILGALWFKTPTRSDLRAGIVLLGWFLGLVLVVARTAELIGLIPMVDVGDSLLGFEQEHYWLPLQGWLGPEGRWPGPMGHNAQTGNVAAMLLVLAIGLRGRARWGLALIGVTGLLLTSSRTSFLGAVAGVVILLILDDNPLTRRVRRRWLVLGAVSAGALAAVVVIAQSPNLTGRTTYWALAQEAWSTSPWTGVGSDAITSTDLQTMGTNAHNLAIDAALKYGIVGVIPLLALLAAALLVAGKAALQQVVLPLALLGTFLVIGLAEADDGWLTPSVMWLWFLLPCLWAAAVLHKDSKPSIDRDSQASGEPA